MSETRNLITLMTNLSFNNYVILQTFNKASDITLDSNYDLLTS